MLTDIFSGGLVSGAIGGAIRLGQAALEQYQERKQFQQKLAEKKLDQEHQLRMLERQHQTDTMQAEQNTQQAYYEHSSGLATEQSRSYAQALGAVHQADTGLKTSVWVDNVRALVRPSVLVVSLLALVSFAILELENSITLILADLVSAGTSYYFLDRSIFKRKIQ